MAAYHPWTKTVVYIKTYCCCCCLYQNLFLGFSNNGNKLIFDMRNQKEIALRMHYTIIMITGKKLQKTPKDVYRFVFLMSN